jgi:hypothetical protein
MGIEGWNRPLVHCYDTERRRIVCGLSEQTGSTKHIGAVTCPECLRLLDRRAGGDADAGQAQAGATGV